MAKIAIIDSGLSRDQVKNGIEGINLTNDFLDKNILDNIGHGSAVCYIINKYCDAEIYMIKIFDNEIEINEDKLINALSYVINNLDIDILHMSIGLAECAKQKELYEICKQITDKNTIIVSAFDNDGCLSYPAMFDNVIGVDISSHCKRVDQYEYVDSDAVNIRGISSQQRVLWLDNSYRLVNGSSFAAPHITARIANLINGGYKKQKDILKILKKEASKVHLKKTFTLSKPLFTINKAVLFPFNKEMHSIAVYNDMLDFEVNNIYDIKYMNTIKKCISEILNINLKHDYKIKNITNINWDDDFDTFILGHVREINEVSHIDYKKIILEKCIECNKNIYSFDDLRPYKNLLDKLEEKDLKYYFPSISKKNVPTNRFGKLIKISVPIIGIFGTSSRQGKFTLQLKLRKLFINNGYFVGQLGTEPSSLLFGMDFVYPIGYDSSIEINELDSIITINNLLGEIEKKNVDVILVGSQSQSVAYSNDNLVLLPIKQYNLLLGSTPDVIILCVNIYDDDEYIDRTVAYLESVNNSEVIALVISPVLRTLNLSALNRKTSIVEMSDLLNFKKHLQSRFLKSVYILNKDEDIEEVFNECIDFFSE